MSDRYIRRSDWEEDDADATVYLSRYLRIRLTDPDRNPLPYAKCRLANDTSTIFECDEDGVARIPVRDPSQESVELEWEPRDAEGDADDHRFFWRCVVRIDIDSIDDEACARRLSHLGFGEGTLEEQVKAYQTHFHREPTGRLDDIRDELAEWHDGGSRPGQASSASDGQDQSGGESEGAP